MLHLDRAVRRVLGAAVALFIASSSVAAGPLPATAAATAEPAPGAVATVGATVDSTPDVELDSEPVLLEAGATSGWIRLVPSRQVLGVLTVTAPPGTRLVAADADVRPVAGLMSADGSSAVWSGNSTWSSAWRVPKVRLRADEDVRPGRVSGAARVTEVDGSRVLAAGVVSADLAAQIDVAVPTLASGAESGRVPVRPRVDGAGSLEVTAPTGTIITEAGIGEGQAGAEVSADGSSATWPAGAGWGTEPTRLPWFRVRSVERQDGVRRDGDARIVAADGSVTAHSRFRAIDAGPRPASITVSADGRSTTARVYGLGDAAREQAREARSMRHSDLQPTGRFVRAGERLTVDVPAGAPATGVRVGVYGPHSDVAATSLSGIVATPGGTTTTITADRDGMVFLVSTAASGEALVTVRGGQTVPTFVLGQTTDAEFRQQLVDLPDAPMVEMVAGRVFGDFQRRTTAAFPDDVQAVLQSWDDVVVLTNAMHNLHDDLTGTARKAPHRVYIASPDTGGGYATATHERVTFQVGTGAAANLFRSGVLDQWGLWHEIGHTYQTPAYNWGGQTEVVVNISALEVQRRIGGGNRLDGQQRAIESFFAQPVGERSHAHADVFVRLLMYDQLRRAFGPQFYPRLNQELRVANALGELDLRTDQAKVDAFAATSAALVDRDLRPFFEQWGLAIGSDVAAVMSSRPPLQQAIWENVHTSENRTETEVSRLGTPVGAVDADSLRPVVVGQRTLAYVAVRDLGSSDGGHPVVGRTVVDAPDQGTGAVRVELVDERGIREAVSAPVHVTAGNLIDLLGQRDRTVARLAILPEEHELRLVPRTGYHSHSSWAGREYIGIELRTADDEHSLGDWVIKGDETAHPLAARFDAHWEEGQILVIRHQQGGAVFPWRHDVQIPHSNDRVQRFRIVDGGLVRDDGELTAVSIASPEDGADTDLRPVLSGHGEPGSTVVIRRKGSDAVLGEGHVDHRGEWAVQVSSDLEAERQTLVVTQYAPGDDGADRAD